MPEPRGISEELASTRRLVDAVGVASNNRGPLGSDRLDEIYSLFTLLAESIANLVGVLERVWQLVDEAVATPRLEINAADELGRRGD